MAETATPHLKDPQTGTPLQDHPDYIGTVSAAYGKVQFKSQYGREVVYVLGCYHCGAVPTGSYEGRWSCRDCAGVSGGRGWMSYRRYRRVH